MNKILNKLIIKKVVLTIIIISLVTSIIFPNILVFDLNENTILFSNYFQGVLITVFFIAALIGIILDLKDDNNYGSSIVVILIITIILIIKIPEFPKNSIENENWKIKYSENKIIISNLLQDITINYSEIVKYKIEINKRNVRWVDEQELSIYISDKQNNRIAIYASFYESFWPFSIFPIFNVNQKRIKELYLIQKILLDSYKAATTPNMVYVQRSQKDSLGTRHEKTGSAH